MFVHTPIDSLLDGVFSSSRIARRVLGGRNAIRSPRLANRLMRLEDLQQRALSSATLADLGDLQVDGQLVGERYLLAPCGLKSPALR